MKNLLLTLLALTGIAAIMISLITTQTMAQASLTQAAANAAQASTNLAAQCLAGLMVVIALLAGTAIGAAVVAFRWQRQTQSLIQAPSQKWISGPDAHWERNLPTDAQASLRSQPIFLISSQPTHSPLPQPPQETPETLVEEEVDSFQGWGF